MALLEYFGVLVIFMRSFNTAVCLWSYVKAFCRATTKSGFPPLKTSLALAWTHTHKPLLDRSLKTLKPVSPVFITDMTRRDRIYRHVYTRVGLVTKMFKASVWLTSDVVVGAEHHVCRVDEVVARTFHRDLHFTVTQNHPSSVQEKKKKQLVFWFFTLCCEAESIRQTRPHGSSQTNHFDLHVYLVSMAMGVKSSLCLDWNNSVLARISKMDGGCIGVAMENRASCGGTNVPSSDIRFWPWTSFRRPWKFRAWRQKESSDFHLHLWSVFFWGSALE